MTPNILSGPGAHAVRRSAAFAGLVTTFAVVAGAHAHEAAVPAAAAPMPPPAALVQLEEAKRASARFLEFDERRLADAGYVPTGYCPDDMGCHWINPALVGDGAFDHTQPEILVYDRNACTGEFELVAVEYAVPLELAKIAPAGFAGNVDVWDRNTGFQLWTLHAWVWEYNPAGVFVGYNARIGAVRP